MVIHGFVGGTYGILRPQEIGEILNIRKILEIKIKLGVKGIEWEKEYMENREFIKYMENEGKF